MNVHARQIAFALGLFAAAGSAAAQQIPDRATLYSILGSAYFEEDFESLVAAIPGFPIYLPPVFDRGTVVGTPGAFGGVQGPELVEPGCTYTHTSANLLWYAGGAQFLASSAIVPQIGPGPGALVATYAQPVSAVGFEVVWPGISLNGQAIVTFRDAAGAAVGQVTVPWVPSLRTFVGWQHVAGIASAEIYYDGLNPRPGIDDHAYGLDPAQSSYRVPFGTGCNETYASFYEDTQSFDLSDTSLTLTNLGSRFVATPGTAAVVPPTGPPTTISSSAPTPFPLGWSLPYPGGATSTLYIGRRGFVRYTPDPELELELLTSGPVVAARTGIFNLIGTGTVTLASDPVAQTATITFENMTEWTAPGVSTFQYHFDASGNVEMRFGSCAPTASTTGWSPGMDNLDPGSIDISTLSVIESTEQDVVPLRLTGAGYPVIGDTVNLTITDIPAGSIGTLHILGLTEILPGFDLVTIGMPACRAHVSFDFGHVTATPGATATYGFSVPNQINLVGQSLAAQGFAYDPAGGHNAFGGLTSNGIRLVIGQF